VDNPDIVFEIETPIKNLNTIYCVYKMEPTAISNIVFEIETRIKDIFKYSSINAFLRMFTLPDLRLLSMGKGIPLRIQKGFLLDLLTEYYYKQNKKNVMNELGSILYSTFEVAIREIASSCENIEPFEVVELDFNRTVCSTIIDLVFHYIDYLPADNTMEQTSHILCGIIAQFYINVQTANRELNSRYDHYMYNIHRSIMKCNTYFRRQMRDIMDGLIDIDCDNSDTESECSEEPEWKVVPILIKSPNRFLNSKEQCPICIDRFCRRDMVITNCRHLFCSPCFKSYLIGRKTQPTCPICRESVDKVETPLLGIYRKFDRAFNTKVDESIYIHDCSVAIDFDDINEIEGI